VQITKNYLTVLKEATYYFFLERLSYLGSRQLILYNDAVLTAGVIQRRMRRKDNDWLLQAGKGLVITFPTFAWTDWEKS
jgi:hypothetical protein